MKKTERPSWDKKTQFPTLMTYADERQIKYVLAEKSGQFDFAEYIHHNKDPKEPHFHVVLHLKKSRYVSEIIAWFGRCVDDNGKLVNTMGQAARSTEDMDDYLLHKNDQTKHQYTDEDIKVPYGTREAYRELKTEYQVCEESAAAKEYAKEAAADDVEKQLQDVIDGVPFREMARRYGRDFIKNYRAYHEYALHIVVEETGELPAHLIHDPLQILMNKKVQQALDYGVTRGISAIERAYEEALVEFGVTELIRTNVSKAVKQKITHKEV